MSLDAQQRQLYLEDTYLHSTQTVVCDCGWSEGREWVATRENVAHPQGGGQPADTCTAAGVEVRPVRSPNDPSWVILQALEETPQSAPRRLPAEEQPVTVTVDAETRLRHAALHTAGHLVDAAVRRLGYRHIVSNHFPGQARIEFHAGEGELDAAKLREVVQADVEQAIARDLEVTTRLDGEGQRLVVIGDVSEDRCGGTHVRRLSQLGEVEVRSVKVKKGRLKIGYSAEHDAR